MHLSVPNDVLDAATTVAVPAHAAFAPSEEKDDGNAVALGAAQRPLVIAGPAAMRKGTRELEEATGIPVIGMESPRGVNDPSLGTLAEVLAQADLVLLLGKRVDFTLKFGKALRAGVPRRRGSSAEGHCFQEQRVWLDEVHAALRYRPPEWRTVQSKREGPIHPVALCREVQTLLDKRDAILVSDGGEFGQWAQACLSAPRRLINGPAGSIGSALPFAAAAKLAHPSATVVAMLGDGTLGFHLSEFDTAVRHGLGYVAVIGNDATWNAEYQIQLRAYGSARAKGCELLPTRYGAVAQALGVHGEDVDRPGELQDALRRAVASGKPACVNVMIERLAAPRY